MNSKTRFRIAAVVFVFFAVGHTAGFLSFTPPTAEGIAVRDAMSTVHFTVRGSTFSYGNFYREFGLSATVSMLLQAFLCWQLASLTKIAPRAVSAITWAWSLFKSREWFSAISTSRCRLLFSLWLSDFVLGGPLCG